MAATFLDISRKHVFTASNKSIITCKNGMEKNKLEQILSKVLVYYSRFMLHIINVALPLVPARGLHAPQLDGQSKAGKTS